MGALHEFGRPHENDQRHTDCQDAGQQQVGNDRHRRFAADDLKERRVWPRLDQDSGGRAVALHDFTNPMLDPRQRRDRAKGGNRRSRCGTYRCASVSCSAGATFAARARAQAWISTIRPAPAGEAFRIARVETCLSGAHSSCGCGDGNCDISFFMTEFHISMCFDHLLKWIDPIGYGLNDSCFDELGYFVQPI